MEVDARGLACPQPVIATKKALEGIAAGTVITIVDNAAAKENVAKFAAASGCSVSIEEKAGHFYVKITKGNPAAGQENKQPDRSQGDIVYLISQDSLGHGSIDLGAILIKSFFYTLLENGQLPRALLFINSGVLLTVEGSPVLEHLKALAGKNVKILSCGTCLDYYQVKDSLAVGSVTNMYTIVEEMTAAAKTITL